MEPAVVEKLNVKHVFVSSQLLQQLFLLSLLKRITKIYTSYACVYEDLVEFIQCIKCPCENYG